MEDGPGEIAVMLVSNAKLGYDHVLSVDWMGRLSRLNSAVYLQYPERGSVCQRMHSAHGACCKNFGGNIIQIF